jgi:aspartate aminotransferase-like enzyme
VEIGTAYGLDMVELAYEWGDKVDFAEVEATLAADKSIKAAVCVQCETSSGITNDIEAFGRVTRDVISIVDAASSLGACELRTDLWGIDVVVSGGQKALMTPPGVSFVSISERAWAAHATSKMPRYYFDWTAAKQSFQHKYPHTPWTPAISLIFQLDAALKLILAEGMEHVFTRHILLGRSAREGVKAIGLRLMVPDEDMHSAVTTVWMPEGYHADEMVERLVHEHGVQITDGPGSLKESVFRIGHCGHFDAYDMILTIAAIELTLQSMGYAVELGRGVSAAQRVFSTGNVTT